MPKHGAPKPIRILIADDHEIVRIGARALLQQGISCEICGESSNGRDAVKLAEQTTPDIVVLDLSMPELNGLEVIRKIKRVCPATEFLVLTGQAPDELVHRIFEAGARSYIHKADAAKYLIDAVKALAEHKPFFTSEVSEILFARFMGSGENSAKPPDESVLTEREREIVQLIAEGKSNKEVASLLNISVKTAETHRAAIMRKLRLDSFSDLVRFAIRNKIIEP